MLFSSHHLSTTRRRVLTYWARAAYYRTACPPALRDDAADHRKAAWHSGVNICARRGGNIRMFILCLRAVAIWPHCLFLGC